MRFNCLFPPNLKSLTTSKLTDFSVFQKNTRKTYKTDIHTCIQLLYKQLIVIYNVDIASQDHIQIFLENVDLVREYEINFDFFFFCGDVRSHPGLWYGNKQ